jgi:NAD(P)-dependent dehydrogenase (short-subunit alcohol dehydrogenase family)
MTRTNFEGSTAIVSGASRGFGRAIARELLQRQAHVVGIARGESALREMRHEHGDKFEYEVADAADPSLPDQLFAKHQPRIVVLNAGSAPVAGPLDEQTWDTFSANWNMDVRQVFNFAKTSLLRPLEPGSVVISISSGAALGGSPLSGGYAGAKATVRFISAYAAAESQLRSLGLRFVTIVPTLTPATGLGAAGAAAYAKRAGISVEAFEEQLGPVLTPEHLAKTIADVISDDDYSDPAYFLTGTEFRSLS